MLTLQITWPQGCYQHIGKHKTRNSSLQKFTSIIGRNHSYINIVLTR